MSYAEHGSRIFLTGKFNSNPLLRYGDCVVTRKRSEGRLKLFDSCTDLRAWSPNPLDNCRHFREIVQKRTPSGRIVPYDVLIENLIILGQTELASVRRQLEKYKSLRLTPEQEKQLRDTDYSTDDQLETSDSTLLRETRIVEDDTGVPKRPGTPAHSICSSSGNFQEIEIDDESSAYNNSEQSREVYVSSETNDDSDESSTETSGNEDRDVERSGIYENDENQGIIIEKDSEIIALNHELAAKNDDLEEIREICRNLESSLNEKERALDNLRRNLKISQEQLMGMGKQMHDQNEEWKKRLYDSKCLIDHLKSNLAEKLQNCSIHNQEIQNLRERIRETETLRKDKDSMRRKLDEMKIVLCERNDLIKLNKQQAVSLADQEDEINRLLGFIEQTMAKYSEQEMRMKSELRDLRSELEAKNSAISQFETHRVTVRTDISPTGSLGELETSDIRKLKLALQDDLRAVEEEFSRRRDEHENNNVTRSTSTRNRTYEETAGRDNFQRNKDFAEFKSVEKLTVQVSPSNSTWKEGSDIDEKIIADLGNSGETLRRLIVELEPYRNERVSLIDKIKRLKVALEDSKRDSDSRDLKIQEQYLSEIVDNHRKECEVYVKKIAKLKSLLEEKIHRDDNDDETNEKIDKALAIHVKRSIEKITKLSAGLRGAGDEMAKIREELKIRETEIANLRRQVDFHVSRGQGDEASNENSKEIVRLKSENKSLLDELRNQAESLKVTRNELQSREFELKGSKRQKNDLVAQYKREIQRKNREIEGLAKENEGLNKTVLMINDLVMESDAMKIKLESLQDENTKLIENNSSMIKRCEDYENRLVDFASKEIQTKEIYERTEFHLREKCAKIETEIKALRMENEIIAEEARNKELKINKLTEDIRELNENKRNLDYMENVWTEMSKCDDNRLRLNEKVTRLRLNLEKHYRANGELEDRLKWQIGENEILKNTNKKLNDDIERIKNDVMPGEIAKKLLDTLPDKMCRDIEKLRKQLSAEETEDLSRRSQITAMRSKSSEDDSAIEKLGLEIEQWKNKFAEQEKKIVALEDANAILTEKLEKLREKENSSENKLQADMENEIRQRETEIAKLTHDIEIKNDELRNLRDKIRSLMNEKNELSNELRNEKDLRQTQLTELQQKHSAGMKVFNDRHNDSIKKLLAQQDEFTKNTNLDPFDSETWLRSLTMNEMTELHKRISAWSPCEIIGEASKIRALNDKQNQQLQQDEKFNIEKLHMKNGHHKDPAIGFPYMYERRKFESARQKPVETSLNNNTFDTQRKNFLHQCAIQHKYDSSH